MTISVFIAEDNQMLREGLKAILADRKDLGVIGEASNGVDALRQIKRLKPDLLLLDLSMPYMDGLSVLMETRAFHRDIKILVLTIHLSEKDVMKTFAAGADGYCSKNDSRAELLIAIDRVLAGDVYISPSISKEVLERSLTSWKANHHQTPLADISQREREILKMLAEGCTNKQIGDMLFISPKTVEKHRANIMSKLNIHNVSQLTALAIQEGLVVKRS